MEEEKEYVIPPESIVRRCVANGLLTIDEATLPSGEWNPAVWSAATLVADELRDRWSEWEGFGSSDFTYVAQDFLREAGFKAEFVNNRLTRV